MIELAQLFQDMEALVVQQEPAVTQIEQKGEEVTENVGKANVEMDGAIAKARSRNRKKWWCLLILCRYIPMWPRVPGLLLTIVSNLHHHRRGCRCCGSRCYSQDGQDCYVERFDVSWIPASSKLLVPFLAIVGSSATSGPILGGRS